MKCPKCSHTMIRKKITDHRYQYECPYCHKVVGRVQESTQESERESHAESE